jgi:hypothetical protein
MHDSIKAAQQGGAMPKPAAGSVAAKPIFDTEITEQQLNPSNH